MSSAAEIRIDVEAECFWTECGNVLNISVETDAWNAGLKIDVVPCLCTQEED